MNRAGIPVFVGVGLIMSLTACAALDSNGALAKIELPAQDQANWVMPLDEFSPPSADSLSNYAENLLLERCLGEAGIQWPIPWQPTDDADYLLPPANRSGFPALTVEIAQKWGYRANFEPGRYASFEDRQAVMRELNGIAASTPGFDSVFDTCLTDARKTVPSRQLNKAFNRVRELMGPAQRAAWTASPVIAADAAWRDCLRALGYVNVPDSPLGEDEGWMPTQALRDELGIPDLYTSTGDSAPESSLTEAEIALAVDDATCRETSGWSQAMYEALWDAQVEVVREHADELMRMRDEWDAARATLMTVIAEHAPSR